MRSKEEAHDYRYFPEPDLPPVIVTKEMLDEAKQSLPALPPEIRKRMTEAGVSVADAEVLIGQPSAATLFLHASDEQPQLVVKRIAGWLTGEVMRLLSESNEYEDRVLKLRPERLVELAKLVNADKLSSTAAKTVLVDMLGTGEEPLAIAERLNLMQVSDTGELERIVTTVIDEQPQSANDFRAGKVQALGFLVGQVMKASQGKANPQVVNQLLRKHLGE
jgi:aspartyl-tRNA(Asn)/glutamyl-tRNA(Gln) amidotransferase subunit B